MRRELYDAQFRQFSEQCREAGLTPPLQKDQVAVLDEDSPTHTAKDYDWSYLLHCGWAARVLAQTRPKRHVDFGSYVYFAALCSAFLPNFEFYDLRGLGVEIPGLKTGTCDLTKLPFADNSLESISCLHVLEHVGLGRYGDQLDALGDVKAAKELARALAPGGTLILVLPMDEKRPRICFNGHKFYSTEQVHAMTVDLEPREAKILWNQQFIPQYPEADFTGCMTFTK